MNRRDLSIFLALEVAAIAWAGLVFKIFDSRLLAGLMAGSYFVGFGLFVLWRIWRWPDRLRALTFYSLVVHLFVISIPMMAVRFAQSQSAFEDVLIWGLPGPVFHRMSTTVFSALIACTVIDLIRTRTSRSRKA